LSAHPFDRLNDPPKIRLDLGLGRPFQKIISADLDDDQRRAVFNEQVG